MFGCERVCDGNGLLFVLGEYEKSVLLQYFTQGGSACQGTDLSSDLALHGLQHLRMQSDQADHASSPVLRLRKQIRRHPGWNGGVIGNDHDFAGTRDKIDRDIPEDLAFRFRDVGVSWSEDLEDWLNRLCAESECGDGLHASDLVN